MMDYDCEWRARDLDYSNKVDLACLLRRPGGNEGHLTAVFSENVYSANSSNNVEPCLTLTRTEAQQIMNELHRIGFRAKDGKGTQASVNATEAHLADMRRIAFGKLKMEQP